MINEHILLEKGKFTGFVRSTHSIWKIMALASAFCLVIALLNGCSDSNLDDSKVREKILAEAVDEENLQTRKSPSGEELRYAPNQERPYAGWVKDGRELYQFQNGKPNGIYISWYSNGQNSEKGTFRNGQKIGLWTGWHENGQKESEGTYKNGIQNGTWAYWDKNGQRYLELNYTDLDTLFAQLNESKVREKILTEAIHTDSLPEDRGETSDEELVYAPFKKQPYTGWAELMTQKTQVFIQCKNGKIHGLFLMFYSINQQNVQQIQTYRNGKEDGLFTGWYENGQKNYVATYKNGDPDGLFTGWYENGQKNYVRTYKNGDLDGLFTEWYENGQKKSEGTWKNGKEDGLHTEWDQNGQVWRSETYKDGIGENTDTLTPLKEE